MVTVPAPQLRTGHFPSFTAQLFGRWWYHLNLLRYFYVLLPFVHFPNHGSMESHNSLSQEKTQKHSPSKKSPDTGSLGRRRGSPTVSHAGSLSQRYRGRRASRPHSKRHAADGESFFTCFVLAGENFILNMIMNPIMILVTNRPRRQQWPCKIRWPGDVSRLRLCEHALSRPVTLPA